MKYKHFRCSVGKYVYFKRFSSYVDSVNEDWRWLESQSKEAFEPISQFESIKFDIPSYHPYWNDVATRCLHDLIQSKRGEVKMMEKRIENKDKNWHYAQSSIKKERESLFELIQKYRKKVKYE